MKTYLCLILLFWSSMSYTPPAAAPASEMVVFAGRVSDPNGGAVPGAQMELCDSAGKPQLRILTDIEGKYRFPAMPAGVAGAGSHRVSISHLRFEPIKAQELADGAASASSSPAPAPRAMPASSVTWSRLVTRNFTLAPAKAATQNAVFDPSDPNLAEYYYRKAHLLWDANRKAEAIELFKVYAQVGMNINHVAAALDLAAQAGLP